MLRSGRILTHARSGWEMIPINAFGHLMKDHPAALGFPVSLSVDKHMQAVDDSLQVLRLCSVN
jgi:hypothetical protein